MQLVTVFCVATSLVLAGVSAACWMHDDTRMAWEALIGALALVTLSSVLGGVA